MGKRHEASSEGSASPEPAGVGRRVAGRPAGGDLHPGAVVGAGERNARAAMEQRTAATAQLHEAQTMLQSAIRQTGSLTVEINPPVLHEESLRLAGGSLMEESPGCGTRVVMLLPSNEPRDG